MRRDAFDLMATATTGITNWSAVGSLVKTERGEYLSESRQARTRCRDALSFLVI
jgi:hypothetical protein